MSRIKELARRYAQGRSHQRRWRGIRQTHTAYAYLELLGFLGDGARALVPSFTRVVLVVRVRYRLQGLQLQVGLPPQAACASQREW